MTENEALEILNNECEDISKVQIALKVAREALEEIQQYRAIGTVEELEAMKKGTLSAMELVDIWCVLEDLKKYSAIGTIEEFKALKEKNVAKKVINLQINKMQSFCKDDFGIDIPCILNLFQFKCPNCNKKIASRFKNGECPNCGQKLDWQ